MLLKRSQYQLEIKLQQINKDDVGFMEHLLEDFLLDFIILWVLWKDGNPQHFSLQEQRKQKNVGNNQKILWMMRYGI
jgi:hypothetical protein